MLPLAKAFHYTTWADNLLLEAAGKLDPAILDKEFPSPSINTIRGALVHMLGAHMVWLSRLQGIPRGFPPLTDYPTLAAIKADWDTVHAQLETYIGGMDDATLASKLTYRTSDGTEHTNTVSLLVLHIINHGMDHRVACSAFCALSGSDPGDLNILTYLRKVGE